MHIKGSENWYFNLFYVVISIHIRGMAEGTLVRLSHEWSRSDDRDVSTASCKSSSGECRLDVELLIWHPLDRDGRASRAVVGCSYVGVFPGVFPYGRHPRFHYDSIRETNGQVYPLIYFNWYIIVFYLSKL